MNLQQGFVLRLNICKCSEQGQQSVTIVVLTACTSSKLHFFLHWLWILGLNLIVQVEVLLQAHDDGTQTQMQATKGLFSRQGVRGFALCFKLSDPQHRIPEKAMFSLRVS